MTVSCAEFVLAKLTDMPVVAVRVLLKRYVDDGWVVPQANDSSSFDVFPDAMTAFLKRAGLPFYWSTASGNSTVADWANRYPAEDVVLGCHGHVVLACDGLVSDNLYPQGLPPARHPYGDKRVILIGRTCRGPPREIEFA